MKDATCPIFSAPQARERDALHVPADVGPILVVAAECSSAVGEKVQLVTFRASDIGHSFRRVRRSHPVASGLTIGQKFRTLLSRRLKKFLVGIRSVAHQRNADREANPRSTVARGASRHKPARQIGPLFVHIGPMLASSSVILDRFVGRNL